MRITATALLAAMTAAISEEEYFEVKATKLHYDYSVFDNYGQAPQ